MGAVEIIAEGKIREAMENGEFEHLPGRGKPLDLEEYFALPENVRMLYTLMKNANLKGQEIFLMRTLEDLKDDLKGTDDSAVRSRLESRIADTEQRLRALREPDLSGRAGELASGRMSERASERSTRIPNP